MSKPFEQAEQTRRARRTPEAVVHHEPKAAPPVEPPQVSLCPPTTTSTLVEAQLRFIVDEIPSLIWSTLPDGFTDYSNRKLCEYIGRSFDMMEGYGWLEFVHPDDRERVGTHWCTSVSNGEPYETEYRLRRHDGVYRWFLGRGVPMCDAEGRIVRWFGASTDIEAQKVAEREREKTLRELERATHAKDEFLASASHELRTPLTAILGWARMQREHPELAPRAEEVIERNAKVLADQINDLLDVSRIVANKLAIEPHLLDISTFICPAIDVVRPLADAKRIHLRVAATQAVGRVIGDPSRLQQVVSNLLSNAVKFTPVGGSIIVDASRQNEHVVVRVIDTGRGIARDFLPHVFDRFCQADGSKPRREGGLGLGLSIAKYIVELHGGTLTAASQGVGRGATFTIMLPAPTGDVSPPPSSDAEP